MKRVVDDQQSIFESDHFLSQLCHVTDAKFSQFEHAPHSERRQRFSNFVDQHKMPLTFCRTGVNIPLLLENVEEHETEINFRSKPFIFNGVWVLVAGKINKESLEGKVKFEKHNAPIEEEQQHLSNDQIQSLRNLGLPI